MDPRDKVALKQLALSNALASKKAKVEARREKILNEVNRLVAEQRAIDAKMAALDEVIRARGHGPAVSARTAEAMAAAEPGAGPAVVAERPRPPPPPPPPEAAIRDRLTAALREKYLEADFGIQDFLDLMNSLAPEAHFKFETAWRVCNDLVGRRVLKVASQRMTEKGLVRRFKAVKSGG